KALTDLKIELKYCSTCQMVTLQETCSLCSDSARERSLIMVVEDPLDVIAFERSGYKGLYHVLHGVLSPIDGMGPEQLRMRELIDRCKTGAIQEVIVATNPDVEGEATAAYIQKQLADAVPTITRLAHGLPMGADIEFADQVTLKEAVAGRRSL
ncbi:MAG: recombination mediator RecR, partial [bacterium]|nr:recombination mediator RecR [bacterium]